MKRASGPKVARNTGIKAINKAVMHPSPKKVGLERAGDGGHAAAPSIDQKRSTWKMPSPKVTNAY
jgi:hypothetical protein